MAGTLPGPRPFPPLCCSGSHPGPHLLPDPVPGPLPEPGAAWGPSPPCTLGSPAFQSVLVYPGSVSYARLLCPFGTWESLWARVFEASPAWPRRLGVPRDTSGTLARGLVSPRRHGRPGTGLARCARRLLGDNRARASLRTSQCAGVTSTSVGEANSIQSLRTSLLGLLRLGAAERLASCTLGRAAP